MNIMMNKTFLQMAKEASQAERENNWKEAHELWFLASELLPKHSVNKDWSLIRADFCQRRGSAVGMRFINRLKQHKMSIPRYGFE
jgi:hypothetical protein